MPRRRPERDAAPPAAAARLVAARGKPLPVAQGERGGHQLCVRAAIVAEPERISVRHRRFRDEVAPPQVQAVESVRARGEVDQPLDDEDRLGPARAAVRRRGRRVGEDRAGAHVRGGNAVDAGHDGGALGERDVGGRVRPGVAQVGGAQREKIALCVERELRRHGQVASLVVGEKRLAALAGPLHRAAEASRRPRDQRELGKKTVARAEIPSGIAGHHAHRLFFDAENPRELALLPHHPAAARVKRVAP